MSAAGIRRACVHVLVACGVVICAAVPAAAQGYAVRGGANVNPDQMYVGGQYEMGPFFDRVWFQPNGDVGFGNDATLFSLTFDAIYRRPMGRRSIWTAYGGGGPALNFYKLNGYNATEPGVNLIGGLMHHSGVFTEFRVGFLESPRFRFGAGYAFRPGKSARRVPTRTRR